MPCRLPLLLLALLAPLAASAAPAVVVTLAPAHALTAAVMAGVATPHLLLPGGVSPHHYALRPSDLRALQRARLLIRIDPIVEPFLERVLATLPGSLQRFTLGTLPGTVRLDAREGGVWERDQAQAPGHDHAGEEGDPHLWLDPHNAMTWVRAIAAELGRIDPQNHARYSANADALLARLAALDRELAERLAPLAGIPYVVFHDAYHYFERRYGLTPAGAISVGSGRAPGARRLAEVRAAIRARGARCVFAEPQFEPALVRIVLEGTGARSGVLDPLGAELEPGPGLYFELLRGLASGLERCLLGEAERSRD